MGFPRRLKEGRAQFLGFKDWNSLKETNKRAHTTGNVKLAIGHIRIPGIGLELACN